MTQQLHKQQGFGRQPCKFFNNQSDREFEALPFELKHVQDYQSSECSYIEYEIDSIEEELGELFRVWNERKLLGTFYKTSQGWKAEPFYLCKRYIKAELDLSQSWEKSDEAIAYIQSMYEGKSGDLASKNTLEPKISHLIAA